MFAPSKGESFFIVSRAAVVTHWHSHTVRDEYTVSFLLSDGAAHVEVRRSDTQDQFAHESGI